MAVEQRIHPALCSAFIAGALAQSSVLRQSHQGRIWQEVNVPEPNLLRYPYLFWSGHVRDVAQRAGERESVGKLTSIYDVRSVRRYPQGGADWADFEPEYHELRNLLTGVPCTPIVVGGQTIGTVYQSRYLTDYEMSYRVDGIRVLEKGITIQIIHR